jgi:hypothetical protein
MKRLFTLASYLKNTEEAQFLLCSFSWKMICINFKQKGFLVHFGQHFQNSSGHPDIAGSPMK